jgi:hypothetical protein
MIQDFYLQTFHCSVTAATLTYSKHEIMQAVWQFLLDADFVHAYKHGIVIKFPDGISCHVFLWIFTYSGSNKCPNVCMFSTKFNTPQHLLIWALMCECIE